MRGVDCRGFADVEAEARLRILHLLAHAVRHRDGPERRSAEDDVAALVLVGEPRDRAVLVDARLAVVAHASGEGLLELLPLGLREGDGIVLASQRLEPA